MIMAYLISYPQFNIWNISYITPHPFSCLFVCLFVFFARIDQNWKRNWLRLRYEIQSTTHPRKPVYQPRTNSTPLPVPYKRPFYNNWEISCAITEGLLGRWGPCSFVPFRNCPVFPCYHSFSLIVSCLTYLLTVFPDRFVFPSSLWHFSVDLQNFQGDYLIS